MTNEASTTTEAAAVAAKGARVAPEKATLTEAAKAKKGAPKAKKATKTASKSAAKKEAKPASKNAAKAEARVPREFSKTAIVLDLLRRKDGATLAEIAKATNWQNHSIRGFISGTIGKKMGLKVESTKDENGGRTYRIAG
jgi:hypothetical protein